MHQDLIEAVCRAISDETGEPFSPQENRALGGGCIHNAQLLRDGDRRYFVKTNRIAMLPAFRAEWQCLDAIRSTCTIRVPKPVAIGETGGHAFLVLEYLEMMRAPESAQAILGEQIAAMHRTTGEAYGWPSDNFLGTSVQKNTWSEDWCAFWIESRLRPQIDAARKRGLDLHRFPDWESVCRRILRGHHPSPSLLHGDLWGGNMAALDDRTPVVFDPACYYGDRETDIAFTRMFGGFSNAFHRSYQRSWPFPSGHEARERLYNLYHELNHYNIFGGNYGQQALNTLRTLVTEHLNALHAPEMPCIVRHQRKPAVQ